MKRKKGSNPFVCSPDCQQTHAHTQTITMARNVIRLFYLRKFSLLSKTKLQIFILKKRLTGHFGKQGEKLADFHTWIDAWGKDTF